MRNPVAALLLFILAPAASGAEADWPMWRCDAGRTAATKMELPAELHLQWVRQLPVKPPLVGDDGQIRGVQFGHTLMPVVSGGTLFVGSPVNDSLTAFDVASGAQKWRFHADGPVRLPPAVWNGKVYFVSDDGHLWCLGAADGKLLWKFRGAPADDKVLGDERLISAWPARGGPAVADGRVYFAAGIWPFMHTYVHAVDAETGKGLWCNGDLGVVSKRGYDRNPVYPQCARGDEPRGPGGPKQTIVPLGPLVVAGDKLLIPNNHLGVTCLDRETGKFAYFSMLGTGDWRLCGGPDFFFSNGKIAEVKTGLAVAAYGCQAPPVVDDGALYCSPWSTSAVAAGDLKKLGKASEGQQDKVPNIPELWSPKRLPGGGGLDVWIKAGSRLYASQGRKKIVAIDVPGPGAGGEPKTSWSADAGGDVADVLAAAGRLFVVTGDGRILCFGPEKKSPTTWPAEPQSKPGAGSPDARVEALLKAAGATDGYCLVLGIGTGQMVENVLRQSKLDVVVIDPDAGKVDALRRKLDAAGLYGRRAAVHAGDPLKFGLPPYLASLVVSEEPAAVGSVGIGPLADVVFRSLRPYGGAACLSLSPAQRGELNAWAGAHKADGAQMRESEGYPLLARAGPLPGAAGWTHQYATAGNTLVSADDRVRAPLGLLWFGGPASCLGFDRHARAPAPLVSGGRMFTLGPKGLNAVDVYTGRLLWQANLPAVAKVSKAYDTLAYEIGVLRLGSQMVVVEDGVYVAAGDTCLLLNPATGEVASEIKLAPNQGAAWGPIRIWEDVLVAAVDPLKPAAGEKPLPIWEGRGTASRRLAAFDRRSGKVLWSLAAAKGYPHNAIALESGRVFCLDTAAEGGGSLMALDVRTGKTVWSTGENIFGNWVACSGKRDVVIQGSTFAGRSGRVIAYRAADGKVLWDKSLGEGPWLLCGDMIVANGGGAFDLMTGGSAQRRDPSTGKTVARRKSYGLDKNCAYSIGNEHLVTVGREAAYWNLDADTGLHYIGAVRTGCTNSLVPADGVLNAPYYGTNCGCYFPLRTAFALVPVPTAERPAGQRPGAGSGD